jgi:hypothetical protein
MLGPFLAALWIGYHTPVLWIAFPLVTVASLSTPLSWWAVLIQALLGYGVAVRKVRRWQTLLKISTVDAVWILNLITSVIAALVFGFLYSLRKSHDVPILHYGMLTATALLISWYAVCHLARAFWFAPLIAPWRKQQILVEVTGYLSILDTLYETPSMHGRVILAVGIGIRLFIMLVHSVVFLWSN